MEFTQHTVINAPADQVNLKDWLFTLSDSEYQAAAKGHKAAGTFTTDGVRGMVNVESIGNVLVVQHYLAVKADSNHMEMVSKRSLVYLLHLIPTHVWVRWTMTAAALTKDTTTFSCTVETQLPPLVRLAATLSAFGYFLRKHVDEETVSFAADITRKLPTRSPDPDHSNTPGEPPSASSPVAELKRSQCGQPENDPLRARPSQ
jgi:hypothetical protein